MIRYDLLIMAIGFGYSSWKVFYLIKHWNDLSSNRKFFDIIIILLLLNMVFYR